LFVSNALKSRRGDRSTFARLSFKKYFSNHGRESQCFDRDLRNWQSGHVGESGAFSGLIGAGKGAAGSGTPTRLFTQCA
jgi:hypothetical protein